MGFSVGGFRGGEIRRGVALLQGLDPLSTQYINFEGGARAEKTQFFGQIFPKNCFSWPVFSKFIQTKKANINFESVLKIPPPSSLEKILDPPLSIAKT